MQNSTDPRNTRKLACYPLLAHTAIAHPPLIRAEAPAPPSGPQGGPTWEGLHVAGDAGDRVVSGVELEQDGEEEGRVDRLVDLVVLLLLRERASGEGGEGDGGGHGGGSGSGDDVSGEGGGAGFIYGDGGVGGSGEDGGEVEAMSAWRR